MDIPFLCIPKASHARIPSDLNSRFYWRSKVGYKIE